MVTEAVGELTDAPAVETPTPCRSTCPSTAHLPRDYVARDDVRMEAYRRLAAVTTAADVDDVLRRVDRPLRPAAAARRGAARRRAAACRVPAPRHPGGVGAEGPGAIRRMGAAEVAGSAPASACRERSQVLPDVVIVPIAATRRRVAPAGPSQVAPRDRSARRPRYAPPDETSPLAARRGLSSRSLGSGCRAPALLERA